MFPPLFARLLLLDPAQITPGANNLTAQQSVAPSHFQAIEGREDEQVIFRPFVGR